MKRLVWHQGLVILQDDDDGRWRSHGARKPLPGETADQFPKLLMTTETPATGLTGSANTHARLSPSDKSWPYCTAVVAFREANAHRIRKDDSSADSTEGTEAHEEATEVFMGLKTIDDVPETGMRGAELRVHVAAYIDDCMAQVGMDATRSTIAACIEDAELGLDPPDRVFFVEEQISLWYQPEQTGTADFLGIVAKNGEVERFIGRDLKFGGGVLVTNQSNSQFAIYLYSAIKLLEGVYSFGPETLVEMAAFQPRHREACNEKPWIVTLADLAKFCWDIEHRAIQVREGANRVRAKIGSPGRDVSCEEILEAAPGLVFAPSEGDNGSCRFCKAKAFCGKRLEALTADMDLPEISAADMLAAMPELDKEESKLPVVERLVARSNQLASDTVITDAYLVNAFAKAKGIKKWLEDVEEYLTARVIADGEQIPGLKIVEGRMGNREWANEDEADAWLQNQKLKQEERYDFKLKGPAKIEALLKDKLKTVTRTRNRFEELITRSKPSPKLAVADDKRDAVAAPVNMMPTLDAADDFEV